MKAATWDGVLEIIRASGGSGITNKSINIALGDSGDRVGLLARQRDVQQLTYLLAKAGEIRVVDSTPHDAVGRHFHYALDTGNHRTIVTTHGDGARPQET